MKRREVEYSAFPLQAFAGSKKSQVKRPRSKAENSDQNPENMSWVEFSQ